MKIQEGDIFGMVILLIFYGVLFFLLNLFDFFEYLVKDNNYFCFFFLYFAKNGGYLWLEFVIQLNKKIKDQKLKL